MPSATRQILVVLEDSASGIMVSIASEAEHPLHPVALHVIARISFRCRWDPSNDDFLLFFFQQFQSQVLDGAGDASKGLLPARDLHVSGRSSVLDVMKKEANELRSNCKASSLGHWLRLIPWLAKKYMQVFPLTESISDYSYSRGGVTESISIQLQTWCWYRLQSHSR